jgi:hypothetical protein
MKSRLLGIFALLFVDVTSARLRKKRALKCGLLIVSLCALFAAFQSNNAKADARVMYGAGTISCAEWQKYRLSDDKPNTLQVQAWVDGYLSGYNVASQDVDILSSKPSSIAFYAWIDNYCAVHPLDSVVQASDRLRKELARKARP